MQPDIEIYVLSCPTDSIIQWLSNRFKASEVHSNGLNTSLTLSTDKALIPVTIIEQAAGKRFTSIWFDSEHTPWETDVDCAKDAHAALGCEVRCNYQGWQESGEEDPDQWWRINTQGEGPYIWR